MITWVETPTSDFEKTVNFYAKVPGIDLKQEDYGFEKMACQPNGEGAVIFEPNYKPSANGVIISLRPYIKQYWAMENILERGEEYSQRIISTGLPELAFYFGKTPKADKRNIEGNVLLNGQHNDYYDLLVTYSISMFSVTFQLDGLSHF